MMEWTADAIARTDKAVGLIYSLALPLEALRRRTERQALISAMRMRHVTGFG